MKFVLFVVLYTMNPNVPDQYSHHLMDSQEQCEYVKRELIKEIKVPAGFGASATCISLVDLLTKGGKGNKS